VLNSKWLLVFFSALTNIVYGHPLAGFDLKYLNETDYIKKSFYVPVTSTVHCKDKTSVLDPYSLNQYPGLLLNPEPDLCCY
jgi:hypothetical protein